MPEQASNDPSAPVDLLAGISGFSIDDLDLTPEERKEFVKAQRGLDLIRRTVEREQVLSNPSVQPETPTGNLDQTAIASGPRSDHDETGRIGRFEIVREIGRGGFGVVLLARDPRLDRMVALKIPRTRTIANDELSRRFQREATSAAMLGHPNIVPILESGSAGPIQYIAFEFCPGMTLGEWLTSHAIPLASVDAAELIATLAQAVQHAHSRGVVHRDLKPGNVLLYVEPVDETFNSSDTTSVTDLQSPRIADFGLAKIGTPDASFTQTGATLGTPAYMSPEQARGDVSEIGPRTDVYALGAILYELITGQVPFSRDNNLQTLRAIETEPVQLPSTINSQIPSDLQSICLKCLEKRPEDRYPSAAALEADLHRFLRSEPILARPASTWNRCLRFAQRNKALVTLSSIFVAGMLVATTISIVFGLNELEQRQRADQLLADKERMFVPFRDANLALVLDVAENIAELEGSLEARREILTKAAGNLDEIAAQSQDDPETLYSVANAFLKIAELLGGFGSTNVGDFTGSEEAFRKAKSIASALSAQQPNDVRFLNLSIVVEYRLGGFYLAEGQHAVAQEHCRHALDLLVAQNLLPGDSEIVLMHKAAALGGLGAANGLLGDDTAALQAFEEAAQINRQLAALLTPDNSHIQLALAQNVAKVGAAKMKLQEYEGAIAANEEAMAIYEQLTGESPERLDFRNGLVQTCYTYSNLLLRTDDFDRMNEVMTLGLDNADRLLTSDPENATAQNLKGELLFMMGQRHNKLGDMLMESDTDAALEHLRQSLLPYKDCLALYSEMQAAGKLRARQQGYIDSIRQQISTVEGSIESVSFPE